MGVMCCVLLWCLGSDNDDDDDGWNRVNGGEIKSEDQE